MCVVLKENNRSDIIPRKYIKVLQHMKRQSVELKNWNVYVFTPGSLSR